MEPFEAQTSTLDEFAIIISVTLGVALGLVALCVFVVTTLIMIIQLLLRALRPSHPIDPHEDID